MVALAVSGLSALKRLYSVALFVSQLYVLSGRAGSLMTTEHSKQQFMSTKGVTSPSTNTPYTRATETTEIPSYVSKCPSNGLCSKLPPDCMTCKTNFSCVYGKPATFDCKIKPQIHCVDQRNNEVENFTINMTCQFCWQLEPTDYVCTSSTSCMTVSCPRQRYNANCTVHDHIHCLGNRVFPKMLYCNWTGGYKWSTALALRLSGLANVHSRRALLAHGGIYHIGRCAAERASDSVADVIRSYDGVRETAELELICKLDTIKLGLNEDWEWMGHYTNITLGGFGADRFYLGQWREGLGKLFSFGGLGIWTLIDVLLIGVGYVGPADGSLYI